MYVSVTNKVNKASDEISIKFGFIASINHWNKTFVKFHMI